MKKNIFNSRDQKAIQNPFLYSLRTNKTTHSFRIPHTHSTKIQSTCAGPSLCRFPPFLFKYETSNPSQKQSIKMTSSFSPYISVNLFSSTYKRLLLNFYSRVFVQTKILTHYINWLQGVHSPKPFPTIIPCTQVNRSPAMEFKITVQHPHSDQVDEYVLPVPTEGSRLCVNVTIDGANQRPVVAIGCQQIVQAIQHTGPTHRSEPPPLVSIEDSDDSGSNTTVELVLNESDEDNNQ